MALTKKKIYPNKMEKIFLLVIILLLITIIAVIVRTNIGCMQRADNGVMDLSDWDFEKQGTVTLSGKWAFYWEKFVNSEDGAVPDMYAQVPGVWNSYTVVGEKLPAYGFATYRLRVEGVQIEHLAMRVPPCSTAYELYIDGELLAQNGTVTRTEEGFMPEYALESIMFSPDGDDFTITMHVSNYVYARGGAWYPAVLGTPSQIGKLDLRVARKDWFLVGSFITISLFSFWMFFLGKRSYPILLFAFLALVTTLRTTLYGTYILSCFVPFRLVVAADYISLVWMSALLALFLLSLADKENPKKRTLLIVMVAGMLTAFIILTPIHVFTRFTIPFEVYTFLLALYALFWMLRSDSQSKLAISLGAAAFIVIRSRKHKNEQ